jgi:hypothetical protein
LLPITSIDGFRCIPLKNSAIDRGARPGFTSPADLAGDAAMMGVQEAAARLFYDFCLDDHVPDDHQLRASTGILTLTTCGAR